MSGRTGRHFVQKTVNDGSADVRNPPAPAGFFTQEGLYGDGGQPRAVITTRHQHALFHAPLQLTLESIPVADETPFGVVTRRRCFTSVTNVLTGSVPSRRARARFAPCCLRSGLVAAEPFRANKTAAFAISSSISSGSGSASYAADSPIPTAAPRGNNKSATSETHERGRTVPARKVGIGRDIAANLRVIPVR